MGCTKFIVQGKVQKVFYRKYVSQALAKTVYIGYIRNLSDGTVEVVLKTEPNQNISEVLKILNEGSPKSEVTGVDMTLCDEETKFTNSFEVRY